MPNNSEFELEGEITRVFGNNMYELEVTIEGNKRTVRGHCSGRMRQNKIRIIPGDRVRLVLPPPFELARITYAIRD